MSCTFWISLKISAYSLFHKLSISVYPTYECPWCQCLPGYQCLYNVHFAFFNDCNIVFAPISNSGWIPPPPQRFYVNDLEVIYPPETLQYLICYWKGTFNWILYFQSFQISVMLGPTDFDIVHSQSCIYILKQNVSHRT